jgi:amino acid adenylation domain-containing protein/non-ribosomal peptide synthase protein (TIGR01720 family)
LIFENYPVQEMVAQNIASGELSLLSLNTFEQTNYDFVFIIIPGETITIRFQYNSNVYDEAFINGLQDHLTQLIEKILETPTIGIDEIDYLSEAEKHQLLVEFNNTAIDYPKEKTIISLFEEQVNKTPDKIALLFEDIALTYKELNEKSNQLGDYLRKQYNIQADDLIGIQLERSEWMIIAILGVLKSGGAYVPIDSEYPQERIDYMIADSQCKLLIDDKALTKFKEVQKDYDNRNLKLINKAEDLAYVIYTSGSTGKPKGIMIEHKNTTAFINWCKNEFENAIFDTVFGVTSICFDLSIFEFFYALSSGKKLRILTNALSLPQYLNTSENVLLNTVPSVVGTLLSEQVDLSAVKVLNMAGEAIPAKYIGKLDCEKIEIRNLYGPSEDTTYSTAYRIKDDAAILIGRPIANTTVYILDENQHVQPIGVTGEICLSGAGLARGYLNQPRLTSEKFVPNPFKPGERMYKTGDLGKWLPDGNIAFIGRKDDQVKIRGYRIELAEIESALEKHAAIDGTVVLAKTNKDGYKELIAYIVSKETLNVSDIRTYLSKLLPVYMLPGHYVQLAALPLTANGKVDKTSLPDPEVFEMGTGVVYVAPRNEIEQNLAAVYEEVLKKQPVGIKEDFFALGGDSIKSIQVVSRLKQRGYSLTIQDLMRYPVIEDLTGRVQRISRLIDQGLVEGVIPLSPIQSSFFERGLSHKHHYNQSVLLYSKDPLSAEALRASLDTLVLHHDVLRMVYYQTSEGWVQENRGKDQKYSLEVMDDTDEMSFRSHCERIQSSINLSEGPLFKAGLFRSTDGDRLLLVAHHLIIDGVSWRILFEDLSSLYQQYISGKRLPLPLKTDSFKYWQEKQLEYAKSARLQQEEAYWSAMEFLDLPSLPLDYMEGSNLIKDVSGQFFLLDENSTNRLLTQCYRAYHTDVNDMLLSAFSIALAQVLGLDKVLISLEGHGREDIGANVDVTRTVGWFTTVYPVVFDMRYRDDIIRHLIAVKETLHRVPNKGIGYGILRYISGKLHELSPEITFNYLGDFGSGVKAEQGEQLFEFSGDYHGSPVSADEQRGAVLDASGMIVQGKLRLSINYSTKQYSKTTIERLLACYQQQLENLAAKLSVEEKVHLTPADLTYKDLSVEQVQELNADFKLEDIYPLSPLQEGLYYHWLSSPSSLAYHEQMSYQLQGELNIEALAASYKLLVYRHAILRTCFTQDLGERTLQIVRKEVDTNFTYQSVERESAFSIEDFKRFNRVKGFDLHTGSQMRLAVLGLGDNTYEFIWSFHHILMDGWCVGILIKEFFQLYYGIVEGKTPKLNEVYPYSMYIQWLMNRDKEKALQYWSNYLSGYNTIRAFPKKIAKEKPEYHAQESRFSIDVTTGQSITSLCAKLGITENTFIQTVWGILLGKYNNTNDVVFGAVVSGRPEEIRGIEEMIGLFINTIPVRIQMKEATTITQLLKEVQQSAIEGSRHHYTQLAEIQSGSELGRDLFDHILIFENYPVEEMVEQHMASRELSVLSSASFEQTNYDFAITVIPGKTITIRFEYNSNVYDDAFIRGLQDHFTQLIEKVLKNPTISIHEIEYLSEEEKHRLLVAFNDTGVSYPQDKTIVNLFEEQVEKTPENIALLFEKNEFTYRELNDKSNQLSNYLRHNYQIQPDDLIGIKLERSEWMIISLLGVLKSGGAYVFIDPEYPRERIDYMITDSNCKVIIDEKELERFKSEENRFSINNLALINKPADLAYVIYTSGTTGEPKGVMIEHRSLLDYATTFSLKFNLEENDRVIQQSSFSFDTHVEEIYPVLLKGGSILVSREGGRDINELNLLIQEKNATVLSTTPPVLRELNYINIDQNQLRLLISGGDKFSASYISNYIGKLEIYDSYGPSESTVCSTFFKVENENSVSIIGQPLNNRSVYILSNQHELQPIEVIGEICIGGQGLARGYLNRPALTAEKFIPNPFKKDERLYKTGDLGRWLPDGNIEFLGRKDYQVKIRGYRIEMGEIEIVLQRHPQIDSAIVVANINNAEENELLAYITAKEMLNTSDLRSYLSKSLPMYMIPRHFVQLASFPITTGGKVDRKNLPAADSTGRLGEIEYIPPHNETEEKLVLIWQEILGKEKIGVKDNFFDWGGHSLKVTRLSAQIQKEFEVKLALKNIFANPTIEEISDMIMANKWIENSKLVGVENRNIIEV